jgi:hypothetical protein
LRQSKISKSWLLKSRPASGSNPLRPAGILASAQSAADSSRSVAEDIVDLNGHADATFAASNEVLETAKRLLDHTRGVQSNVDSFLRHVTGLLSPPVNTGSHFPCGGGQKSPNVG